MTLDPRPQPRRLSACCRHPSEPVTGFCAPCLRERLAGLDPSGPPEISSASAAAASELRRSKSCSVRNREASSEPRRKSCDVRGRSSLQHLFSVDDVKMGPCDRDHEIESKNLGLSRLEGRAIESGEEEDEGRVVRVSEDALGCNSNVDEQRVGEAVEEEFMTMKEHIDLELQSKKHTGMDLKGIAGSVFVAASVFSKKLQKWKLKQKNKKHRRNGSDALAMQAERKLNEPQTRETRSEVADYGFGRRSCDIDPRFSVDAARISTDDPRFSFDEHRASWDGYLIARTIPRLTPMLSVVENAMMAPAKKFDHHRLSVEEQMNSIIEDETTSGGSGRTRDYCSDSSSSQRRSSFDRGSSGKNSTKKALGSGVDEVKSVLNAKMSPSAVEIFHGTKLLITDSSFLKDDQCKSFQSVSKNATSVPSGGNPKGVMKSNGWRKMWKIWGTNSEDVRGNAIDNPLEDCCQEPDGEANGALKGGNSSPKLARSSSCVGSRCSDKLIGSYNSTSVTETEGITKKNREEFVLDRHRSARYSPSNTDSGLLRFYLTPLRSYRSKSGKSRLQNSNSVARSVFRLN